MDPPGGNIDGTSLLAQNNHPHPCRPERIRAERFLMTKRPVGRPKRPNDGRPRRLLSIRLSDAEYRWIRDHTDVESRREILLAGRKDDGNNHG